jgi:hypothetical protein
MTNAWAVVAIIILVIVLFLLLFFLIEKNYYDPIITMISNSIKNFVTMLGNLLGLNRITFK